MRLITLVAGSAMILAAQATLARADPALRDNSPLNTGAPATGPHAVTPDGRQFPDLGKIGNGRRTFLRLNCYGCHGQHASGGEGPDIRGAPESLVEHRLEDGGSLGMRSFKAYTNGRDVHEITAYLASIGTKREPMWVDWWDPNPKVAPLP